MKLTRMGERAAAFAATPVIWVIFLVVWVILTIIISFYALAYPIWALAGKIELKSKPKTNEIEVNIK